MATTLRVLVAPGVLRGVGLDDKLFDTNNRPDPAPPVTPVPLSNFSQPGDTLAQAIGRIPSATLIQPGAGIKTMSGFSMGRGGSPVKSGYGLFAFNMTGWYDPNGELQMVPNSSIDAATINSLTTANGDTNNFSYMRLGHSIAVDASGNLSNPTFNAYFCGTLRATPQGSDYNGLQMYGTRNHIVELSYFYGFPGSSGAPPGENFFINQYRCEFPIVRWVVCDMQNVGSAGIGSNYCKSPYISDSIFKNSGFGAGVTHYLTSNPTYERVQGLTNHLYGLNFEKVSGLITMRECTTLGNRVSDICVDTDGPSAVVNIYDPVYAGMNAGGKLHIKRHNTYAYPPGNPSPPNQQKISDFHIFRNGIETTADELAIDT